MPKGQNSLRGTLLLWLLVPTVVLLPLNAFWTYFGGITVANTAYDRSLLVSARTIAERIQLDEKKLSLELPYAALDMSDNDLGGDFYFRVTGLKREHVAGFDDFPSLPPNVPLSKAYPALVHFYDAEYRGRPVRVAALHQPVSGDAITGVALIQVAETLESRSALTHRLLIETLVQQGLLLALSVLVILFAVGRGLRPLERVRVDLERRDVQDLTPLDEAAVPSETRAFVAALNRYVVRLSKMVELRKSFIANAAHQLRTPIAVLKTQIGVAKREKDPGALGDVLAAIDDTTQSAARLANQLLSLTRAEHGLDTGASVASIDLLAMARHVGLEAVPRAMESEVDIGLDETSDKPVWIYGDAVLLQELLINLVDNAIKYAGPGSRVTIRALLEPPGRAVLEVEDNGPGIPPHEREHVCKRFYRVAGQTVAGSGLGLAIVQEIVSRHNGRLELLDASTGKGLRVRVELPVSPHV
ncbi:sensor histidine kinase [Piscinibacter sp. HJYY11]|uniref:sensor histidine kinase n=1 Tax=Piscinibacter sp. HJYY11 TaxID=2801333 RepID=UPI00191D141B|nr:sensor histidine kinase [Piscinibacter sp. HJYY11]MBL0729425.1 sensor histidine kinase N-terminal domain-containing protein [Piscinibacter sp. HJYY11]